MGDERLELPRGELGRGDDAIAVRVQRTGADGYVTKPFEPRERVARIQTVLRRGASSSSEPSRDDLVRFDGWELRRSERRLTCPRDQVVTLTNAGLQALSPTFDAFGAGPDGVIDRCALNLRRA